MKLKLTDDKENFYIVLRRHEFYIALDFLNRLAAPTMEGHQKVQKCYDEVLEAMDDKEPEPPKPQLTLVQ